MTDEMARRWDDAMEKAWRELRRRVADRLAGLAEGETALFEVPQDEELLGARPYCQVAADEGWLRIEAVSNEFLDVECQLSPPQQAELRELGFEAPREDRSPNFWVEVEQREADRAAVMIVMALRYVYGVLHPVCLEADRVGSGAAVASDGPAADDDEPTTFPRSDDDVRAALTAAVTSLLGHEPEWDEDGDLPIATERSTLYITPASKMPRILMHALLVVDVVDEQRALVEVNLLNKREFGLTFVLAEGRISVRRELPVTAFVPQGIRTEVERICGDLDEWVSELILRVGGRGALEDGSAVREPQDARRRPTTGEPEDELFQRALRVLRELEGEQRGSVDPATIVRIFHTDRELLLAATRWAVSRAIRWEERRRKADEEGKSRYARACRAQQRYYLELRGRIRKALRAAVQAPARGERQEQLSLFAEDDAGA